MMSFCIWTLHVRAGCCKQCDQITSSEPYTIVRFTSCTTLIQPKLVELGSVIMEG